MAKGYTRKSFIWLPYTKKIDIKGKQVHFTYKGGKLQTILKKVLIIMFYGAVPPLSQEFLELCAANSVPLLIHRRNMPVGVCINPTISSNREDILSKQITYRENKKKSQYITKRLLRLKFKSMDWLVTSAEDSLRGGKTIDEMRIIESWHAKRYWEKYYTELGHPEWTRRGKTKNDYISELLDISSKFMSGIVLRWILYHKFSPYHGFLHTPSEYPSLVYDLMEPYRGFIDRIVFELLLEVKGKEIEDIDVESLSALCIEKLKEYMDKKVYINATRQIVTFQELYHGSVLALRTYLLGSRNLILPFPGKPNGGRPVKAGYKLYGRQAGKTDFWVRANEVADSFSTDRASQV